MGLSHVLADQGADAAQALDLLPIYRSQEEALREMGEKEDGETE